jgi:hypothetical protein
MYLLPVLRYKFMYIHTLIYIQNKNYTHNSVFVFVPLPPSPHINTALNNQNLNADKQYYHSPICISKTLINTLKLSLLHYYKQNLLTQFKL